jgi:hypothetical protein
MDTHWFGGRLTGERWQLRCNRRTQPAAEGSFTDPLVGWPLQAEMRAFMTAVVEDVLH